MLFDTIFIVSSFFLIKVDAASYLGCYVPTENSQLSTQKLTIDNKLTPKSCADLCQSLQFPYAALQETECRCDRHKPPELAKENDKDCDHPCPGDRNAKCGRARNNSTLDANRASVYETGFAVPGQDIVPARLYVDCYVNASLRGIEIYGPTEELKNNSPAKCHEICYQQGFRYFALSRDFCTCGDDLPLDGIKSHESTANQCGSKCSGDKKEYCGGALKEMFAFHATGIPNIPEDGRFLGCFKNTNLEDINPNVTLTLTNSNSNQRCLNICDQKGFQFSGVQRGAMCLCLNQIPSTTSKQNNFFCEKEDCPGEITKKCGSEEGIKVFKTRISDKSLSAKSRYLGCFKHQRDYRDLHEIKVTSPSYSMTVAFCMENCKLKGFAYSSLVYGEECFCSQLFPSANEKVSSGDCSFPCSGNRKQYCGGRNLRGVYNNGIPSIQSYAQYYYLGCYEDIESERNVIKGTKTAMNNLSPNLCHKHCLLSGAKYFGLTLDPKVCFCSDVPPPEDLRYGEAFKYDCPVKYRSIIFRTGLVELDADQSFKGCYRIDDTVLKQQVFNFMKTLTPKRCLMLCDMYGFSYSAVNEGWDCQCGSYFPNKFPLETEDKCSIRCPEDPTETCGGPNSHAKVYHTSLIGAPEQPPQTERPKNGPTFSENFNALNTSVWSYTIKMAYEPDYEFVTYDKSDQVVYAKQGKLFINPKLQPNNYVNGATSLRNCTGKLGSSECTRKAENYYILPPVLSGQVTTINSFSFTYGKVEIRAKLPIGDWIVPEIWLTPKINAYGNYYQSGQIRIAMSRGNTQFQCSDEDYGHKRLEMGVYLGPELSDRNKVYLFQKTTPDGWSSDFHNYTVIWNSDTISFQVDGEELGKIQPSNDQTIRDIVGLPKEYEYIYSGSTSKLAPFDKEFYITLGVSVGGLNDFPDNCVTNPKKSWSNTSPKAMLNFWQKRDQWKATWKGENSALQVESVNVWSL